MTKGQDRSKQQEKRITKTLSQIQSNVRRQKASGSMWYQKSDVVSEEFQIEAKTRASPARQIIVKKEWMEKIEEEAFQSGKTPVLAISFGDNQDYFVLKAEDLIELIEKKG